MFWKKKPKLNEEHVGALVDTVSVTFCNETSRIFNFQITMSSGEVIWLVRAEAYLRGLINSLSIGILHGAGIIDISKLQHINMSSGNQRILEDLVDRSADEIVKDAGLVKSLRPSYEKHGKAWTSDNIRSRLNSAAILESDFFNVGLDDGIDVVSFFNEHPDLAETGIILGKKPRLVSLWDGLGWKS